MDSNQGHSLALLTDLYQLTMAYGYWRSGMAERQAAFHLFFRKNPFGGGYAIACGLEGAIEYLQGWRFTEDDLRYLSGLTGNDGRPLFGDDFLAYLGDLRFTCDVDAMPEGSLAFAHEPMLRISGPIVQCQIVETALLTIINYSTLVASKAARVCQAAAGEPVLEFGLRRAQGVDGGLSASRAAYVGGAAATSNVLAGKRHDIPVKGTHAHSWVMFFEDERLAFERYAEAMPNNCIFLVDTYDTLAGVRHAVEVGRSLRERGHELVGVRLDSGDQATLSIEARRILDEGGFPKAAIVGSSDLDEYEITALKGRSATISVWGVGTRLATCYEQPALGGVYKLAAVRGEDGAWDRRIKLSEDEIKTTNPGLLQVRRYSRGDRFVADLVYDIEDGVKDEHTLFDIGDQTRSCEVEPGAVGEDVLVPIFRAGELVYELPSASEARARAHDQVARLDPGVRRLRGPRPYPVGLERAVHERKQRMSAEARARTKSALDTAAEYRYRHPRPALAVDCVVFGLDLDEDSLAVLLIRRRNEPFAHAWALPGGFVHMDETADAAARRELHEETGIDELYLEQLYTFTTVDRDPRERVVSVAYYGLARPASHSLQAATDAEEASWFDIGRLPPLAFDHQRILDTAVERLRGKVRYAPIGFELLPAVFTLSQLQRLYELVLGRELDKRNFRKKILAMALLVDTGEREQGVAHRAARLYRFDRDKYEELTRQGLSFAL
ncbi:nicotinate phosphoribosyltransferase [Haliangium sp.]|uniref:nicotinate phosphoribosyltransferase n=1 Tax=Haliangium sp. TaxID=2663208 RepID=UPI003D0B3819